MIRQQEYCPRCTMRWDLCMCSLGYSLKFSQEWLEQAANVDEKEALNRLIDIEVEAHIRAKHPTIMKGERGDNT